MANKDNSKNIDSSIEESFSKYARSYDKHAQLQKSMAERLASMLPEKLPKGVTEIGCGTGLFTRHLLTHPVGRLVLNDIAPGMVEFLKEQIVLPENTRLVIGNAEKVKFPQTDLIVANAVFQWFQDPLESLTHLAGFLKPKGGIIFSTFGPATLKEFREVGSFASPAHLHSFDYWKKIIKKAGLTLLESHSEVRKTFFPSSLALTRNLQQIGAAPFRLVKPGGLRKLIREYDEKFATGQGVYASWEVYYFSAHR